MREKDYDDVGRRRRVGETTTTTVKNTSTTTEKMTHMTRELFGRNEVSNEAALKMKKLEARFLSGKKMPRGNHHHHHHQRPGEEEEEEENNNHRDVACAEKETLEDSEEEEGEEANDDDFFGSSSSKEEENSRDSQRENRVPKSASAGFGTGNTTTTAEKKKRHVSGGDASISGGKKRKKSGANSSGEKSGKGGGGFASVRTTTTREENNNNTSGGLRNDGGMIAQLESATGVSGRIHRVVNNNTNVDTALHTSPRFDHRHHHQQGGGGGGGGDKIAVTFGSGSKSRDGSDVPKEVFQPPLQRELFGNVVHSSAQQQMQLQQLQLQQQQQREQIKVFQEKILALQQQVEEVTREREDAERQVETFAKKLQTDGKEVEIRRRRARLAFVQLGKLERAESRRKLRDRSQRLGCVAVRRVGTQLNEVWEDGEAFAQLEERTRKIAEQKKDAEERRRAIKRKLPPPGTSAAETASAAAGTKNTAAADKNNESNNKNNNDKKQNTSSFVSDVHREFALSEEVHKTRVNQLRREEEAISREREVLEREKLALAREIKRTRDEDDSRFNDFPMLGAQEPGCERYVLTNLLGRGGFSEVYRAWDCHEMKEVACKLHSLNPRWSEERKRAYVRHAARECSIHKSLKHDHVVKLLDVFEVDSDTFCTVLELCEGDDLDARLKNTGSMSEREARAIVAQIFAGLAYCHGDTKRVIHYDLKPGNILFDNSGRVKITDFGLSKVMESRENIGSNNDFTSVELTSQGAGTYWYLPPECFETGPAPPKISSKVDVWSVGVIFYQMVYGKRPFGHEQTQEQILQAGTIRDAKKVEFPQKPALSNEAKEFICKCLSYRQSERPDVMQAALDPYLQFGGTNGK